MLKKEAVVKGKWLRLGILILGGGTIYKLSSLKDAFYVPMQEVWGLSHTQIGFALSVYSIVMTIGYGFSMFLADRFSKKKLIPISMLSVGLIGFYLATLPGYYGFLLAFALLAVFGEMAYWPTLLKAVRLLGSKGEQGRLFGFLEAGRGVVDTIVAFSALWIYHIMNEGRTGLRAAIIFFSVVVIVLGIVTYFFLEDDVVRDTNLEGKKVGKTSATLEGIKRTLKYKDVWFVSFSIFFVYGVYCGLTYFIPFLSEIYLLPATAVGAYGIVNQYGLKMLGGPIGGFISDKKLKSPTKFLNITFIMIVVFLSIFMVLPHGSFSWTVAMILTLSFGAIVFSQRAVFFAPMEEINTPREISGSAMGFGSLVGYAPSMFAYTLYGSFLDKNPGIKGYRMVWGVMIIFGICGFICTRLLLNSLKEKQLVNKEINS